MFQWTVYGHRGKYGHVAANHVAEAKRPEHVPALIQSPGIKETHAKDPTKKSLRAIRTSAPVRPFLWPFVHMFYMLRNFPHI